MQAFAAGLGVVRDFVLSVARLLEGIHRDLEKIGVRFGHGHQFATAEALEILSVLLVGEAIGGNVVRIERDRLAQRFDPLHAILPGNAKNQVEVHIGHARLTEDFVAAPGLCSGVDATEGFQKLFVPRLHPHAYAVDAECQQGLGFFK